MDLGKLLLGRRLANRDARERKIGTFEAVPAMGLDALGSSAYGPEAALAVLAVLGTAGTHWLRPVTLPIVALLVILFVSYRQTIRAYPHQGGAYYVARCNLGVLPSLFAAAALMIDYVLNVAVGISAGVAVLVSLLPSLHAHTLALCLGVLALLTLTNLRGTQESGRLFALPTYTFIASFVAIVVIGTARALAAGGHPAALTPPPAPHAGAAVRGASLIWLLLRAFASGCTAMTGVEAVSNGMGAFREPSVRYGTRTLALLVLVLGVLLAGIAYLAPAYGVAAMDQTRPGYRTVLAQIAGAVLGHGALYAIALVALVCVLTVSANTSFVAFPRLCRSVAADGFLPQPFAVSGRRLVYTVGVLYLAACAGVLLLAFGGITDRLIPLFAVGAFLSFTLSQAAMVAHWRTCVREAKSAVERRRHRVRAAINATGATTTALALAVIVVAKFAEGAWITVLVLPCVIGLLLAIRSYYAEVERLFRGLAPLALEGAQPPVVLVAIEHWNRLAAKALEFGIGLSPDVVGVHLTELEGPEDDERERTLRERWREHVEAPARAAGLRAPPLRLVQAPFRTIHEPLLALIREIEAEQPQRRVAVLIPELVKQHWYQQVLHSHRGRRLRAGLLRHGGSRVTVISVPWYLDEPGADVPPGDAGRDGAEAR
ncbi:MAG TPA: APC family permease [Dokdonella sp.]